LSLIEIRTDQGRRPGGCGCAKSNSAHNAGAAPHNARAAPHNAGAGSHPSIVRSLIAARGTSLVLARPCAKTFTLAKNRRGGCDGARATPRTRLSWRPSLLIPGHSAPTAGRLGDRDANCLAHPDLRIECRSCRRPIVRIVTAVFIGFEYPIP